MANEVLKKSTTVVLSWTAVSGANRYQLQVASYVDFSGTLIQNDATLVAATKSFTDGGTDNTKRWWRWRSSTDAGTTWAEWSDVGMYWMNSAAANDVLLTSNQWALINPADVTDIYKMPAAPWYKITHRRIYRTHTKNRQGVTLSEFVTNKAEITLDLTKIGFVYREQYRAMKRFSETILQFYLAAYLYNGVDYVPHIFLVELFDDLDMEMLANGRADLMVGQLVFAEV